MKIVQVEVAVPDDDADRIAHSLYRQIQFVVGQYKCDEQNKFMALRSRVVNTTQEHLDIIAEKESG